MLLFRFVGLIISKGNYYTIYLEYSLENFLMRELVIISLYLGISKRGIISSAKINFTELASVYTYHC